MQAIAAVPSTIRSFDRISGFGKRRGETPASEAPVKLGPVLTLLKSAMWRCGV